MRLALGSKKKFETMAPGSAKRATKKRSKASGASAMPNKTRKRRPLSELMRQYQCTHCEKKYEEFRTMQQHLQVKHGVRVSLRNKAEDGRPIETPVPEMQASGDQEDGIDALRMQRREPQLIPDLVAEGDRAAFGDDPMLTSGDIHHSPIWTGMTGLSAVDVTDLDMLGHELWDSPFVSQRIPANLDDIDLFQKLDPLPMCDDWPGFRDVPDNSTNVV